MALVWMTIDPKLSTATIAGAGCRLLNAEAEVIPASRADVAVHNHYKNIHISREERTEKEKVGDRNEKGRECVFSTSSEQCCIYFKFFSQSVK